MKRHPALQDLSRDHHHGLVWAKRLTEAAEDAEEAGDTAETEGFEGSEGPAAAEADPETLGAADDEEQPADPARTAEGFLAFWDGELADHFTEEEHVILPVYQRRFDIAEDELVLAMLRDHAWFRDAVPALRQALEDGEDPRPAMAAIGQRLHDHARMEDRQLFARLEERLEEEELEALHERSRGFRRTHRGEHAIGPR